MKLKNLNELIVNAKSNISNFKNTDEKLHQNFKDKFENVLEVKGDQIHYLDYSAEIIINKSNNKIFLPNQWFYLATFLNDFIIELLNYKSHLDKISKMEVSEVTSREFWELVQKLKPQKNDADVKINEELNKLIDEYFDEENDKRLMTQFLTDYSSWNGSKTIDRHDFYISPILNILGVVNSSQSYIAEIVYFYGIDEELRKESLVLKNRIEIHSEINIEEIKGGKNLIVYGAPGTGKSKYVKDRYKNINRIVFHADYTYYDFIGSYKPNPVYLETSESIKCLDGKEFKSGKPLIDYSFVPGPFITTLLKALKNPNEMHTLLIEEINRANAASVFGDIFQLLDRKKDGSSEYKIEPSIELYNYLMGQTDIATHFVEGLFIPQNMNIIATMNSADQGVFLLDSAFKRRWNFKYIKILEDGFPHEDVLIEYAGKKVKWKYLLKAINDRLKENKVEEDRLIGQFFINTDEILNPNFITSKLFIYLWDDIFRHNKSKFFIEGVRTYSELIEEYHNKTDILCIVDSINEVALDEINTDDVSTEETEENIEE